MMEKEEAEEVAVAEKSHWKDLHVMGKAII